MYESRTIVVFCKGKSSYGEGSDVRSKANEDRLPQSQENLMLASEETPSLSGSDTNSSIDSKLFPSMNRINSLI